MPNSYFQFRRFRIDQEHAAMKVGTDGVLLGAWARGGARILDVGTGTGVVALMMAQRFPEARVVAVEIDRDASLQARQNVSRSPFADRTEVVFGDVRHYQPHARFNAIVTNPPFFSGEMRSPDPQKAMARHTDGLSYADLFAAACRLLEADGVLSAVVPFDYWSRFEAEATLAGFFLYALCGVRTTPRKSVRRYLATFGRTPVEHVLREEHLLETEPGQRSPWYVGLTKDFYL